MRVTAKTEYACLALLELARHHGREGPLRAAEISAEHGIPLRFLVQILLQLKAAGLVRSVRGAAGGYFLARSPREIALSEVLAAVEGAPQAAASDASLSGAARALAATWRTAAAAEQQVLAQVTLADVLSRIDRGAQGMYYI